MRKFLKILKVLVYGILLPVLASIVVLYYYPEVRINNIPIHAIIEASGALVAFGILFILSRLNNYEIINKADFTWIRLSLISMGLLDLVHALVNPGQAFVWFHSIATFCGGVLFSLVWLPGSVSEKVDKANIAKILFIILLTISSFQLFNPALVPMMISNGEFTPLAGFLNIIGGLGYFVGFVYFMKIYLANGDIRDGLFASHCLLFASAGLLFEISTLWDLSWWGWHLLRFMAYGVLFIFFANFLSEINEQLLQDKLRLENDVAQRTKDLNNINVKLKDSIEELQGTQEKMIAQEKLASIGFISAGIAHEIRNPLNILLNSAVIVNNFFKQDLKKHVKENEINLQDSKSFLVTAKEMEDICNLMVVNVERADGVIKSLLLQSKVTGKKVLDFVDINALARESLDLVVKSNSIHTSNLRPSIQFDSVRPVKAMISSGDIRRVFLNLYENSLFALSQKYKNNQSSKGILKTTISENNDYIVISIYDDGVGIPEEIRLKILEPFFTTKPGTEGTGLGLSISNKIVNEHGGDIEINSKQGEFTEFIVKISKKLKKSPLA